MMEQEKNQPANESASLSRYRDIVLAAMQKSQDDYDKAVLSLSGGALALTFAFFQKPSEVHKLLSLMETSWVLLILSLVAILFSFLTGREAHRKAISQVDSGTLYNSLVGGNWARATSVLNLFGGIFLLTGISLAAIFLAANLR